MPYLRFSRPGSVFPVGEPLMVSVYNPDGLSLELLVIQKNGIGNNRTVHRCEWQKNPTKLDVPDAAGRLQIVARELGNGSGKPLQKSNALAATILPDSERSKCEIENNRLMEHRLDSAVEHSSTGVLTLDDPWILPGNAGAGGRWFPTPVFEGATALYNETSAYYEDPLAYHTDQLSDLQAKGFEFVTWHDLLDDTVSRPENAVLLQYDIDAGPLSLLRVAGVVSKLGIRANVMVHRRARHWYEYDIEDTGIEVLQALEKLGWAFGYHNNALTNLVGADTGLPDREDIQKQAQQDLCGDVGKLREYFNIRTLTHHGGNILNSMVAIPEEAKIVCVDRPFSPDIWKPVTRSFSDGSFTSRPCSLAEFVASANPGDGLIFMRCHPLKYGNYAVPNGLDVAPLNLSKADIPAPEVLADRIKRSEKLTGLEKQVVWREMRARTRSGVRLGFGSPRKPVSRGFVTSPETENNIARIRARRRPDFLRQYPWSDGDPRVLWLRVLASYCGKGAILNVGAMPPGQKDETGLFLPDDADIVELDIDPDRQPDILADFCDPAFRAPAAFDYVLLNGLPYFSDPYVAVTNAAGCLKTGGSLLIGAAGAGQPERGGLFRPEDRPIWRRGASTKAGESLSHASSLWSFDDVAVEQLMGEWPGHFGAEFMSHYVFIVARRNADQK